MTRKAVARRQRGHAPLTVIDLMDDDALLGQWYSGPSWATWRAVLRAGFALPMGADDVRLFKAVAGDREPPRQRVKELVAIAGRRAGKDSVTAAIVTAAALGDYSAFLRPGERGQVFCLACDREQAKLVVGYVKAYFAEVPMLSGMVRKETVDGLELTNGVDITVTTASFRSVRGRTVVCAVMDEAAFWRDESSTNPDQEIYRAIKPSTATIPSAMIVILSSPYRKTGLLYDKYRKSFGQNDDAVLVVKGASRTFNPTLDQSIVDEALAADPEGARAEWLGEFRDDVGFFIDPAAVDAVTVPGRRELPPVAGVGYSGYCDPSGGSSDSMTLAIAHADESGRGVLDLIREVKPPFVPDDVVRDFAEILRSYGIARVKGDHFGGAWPAERFASHGIQYEISPTPKSEIYRAFLPLLNSGRVELLDAPRLAHQLCILERRTSRAGRDTIAEPKDQHDDVANAAAGVLISIASDDAPALIRRDAVGRDGAVVPGPSFFTYATMWVSPWGDAAAVFASHQFVGSPKLVISDIRTYRQMGSAAIRDVVGRLAELAHDDFEGRGRRLGRAWLWLPEHWVPLALDAICDAFEPVARKELALAMAEGIDQKYLSDPVKLLHSASYHFEASEIAFTSHALGQADALPFFGGLAWRPGMRERVEDNALRMAALLTSAIGLDAENEVLNPAR